MRPGLLTTLLALLALSHIPPAAAAPSDGEKFRDWTARCEPTTEAAPARCFIFQNLVLKNENVRLLHVAVGYLGENPQPVALFTLPLGVSLPGGVSLAIDEGKPLRFRYERCDGNGCLAPLGLKADLVKSLKAGREARVAFFDSGRREVSVPVSLLGFTAGLNSLDPPPAPPERSGSR